MGFGLTKYIPNIIYCIGILVALVSIFYKPRVGVLFLFPLLPFQNIFVKIQAFPMGKDFTDILLISIMLGMLFHQPTNQYAPIDSEKKFSRQLYKPIILLAIVTLIGLFKITLDRGMSFTLENAYFVEWKNYILLPLVCILTYKNIRDRQDIKLLLTLVIFGLFGASCYFFNELRWVDPLHFSDASRSKIGDLFVYIGANHYAAFAVYTLFFLTGLLFFIRPKSKKLFLLVIILLLFRTLIYTFSRGAYLAFLAGLLFIGLVKNRWFLILLLVLIVAWKTLVPPAVVERIEMTEDKNTGELEDSAATRIELWEIALSMFSSSPLIGNGFGSFRALGYRDTHNIYMKMLAELGILGLLSFLYLCFTAFVIGWKLFISSRDNLFKGLGLGFAASVVTLMVVNAFGDRWSFLPLDGYFWVIFALATRALEIINKEYAYVKVSNEKTNKNITSYK